TSDLDATNLSMTSSGDTAVGITLAFNSIGWLPSNVLFNTVDAIIGTPALSNQRPASVEAFIQNSQVNAEGAIDLLARNEATITSNISNETTSAASALYGATGMAIGAIVGTNKVSTNTVAYIGDADYGSGDGTVWMEKGDRVEHNGTVYEYDGTEGSVNLGIETYVGSDWAA
ncbi:MAG: hypothetical protein GY708_28505, partial [Actinomycetia bacterium]|nr:hypothetical protein [Actinomycetes bacterium]